MGLIGVLTFFLSLGIFFIELNYRLSNLNGVNGFYYTIANILAIFILGLIIIGYLVLKDYFKKSKTKSRKPKNKEVKK